MEVLLNNTLPNFLQENHTTSHRLAHTLLEALYCEMDNSYPEFGNRHGANGSEFRRLQSPYSSRVVFSISLLVVWKADEEGFMELAPVVDEAALEELGPANPFSGTLSAPNGTTETQTVTVGPKRRATPSNTLVSWNKSLPNTLEDL